MSCSDRTSVWCDAASDAAGQHCGSNVAYPFFISFYILCSFLVSTSHLSSQLKTNEPAKFFVDLSRRFLRFLSLFLLFVRPSQTGSVIQCLSIVMLLIQQSPIFKDDVILSKIFPKIRLRSFIAHLFVLDNIETDKNHSIKRQYASPIVTYWPTASDAVYMCYYKVYC